MKTNELVKISKHKSIVLFFFAILFSINLYSVTVTVASNSTYSGLFSATTLSTTVGNNTVSNSGTGFKTVVDQGDRIYGLSGGTYVLIGTVSSVAGNGSSLTLTSNATTAYTAIAWVAIAKTTGVFTVSGNATLTIDVSISDSIFLRSWTLGGKTGPTNESGNITINAGSVFVMPTVAPTAIGLGGSLTLTNGTLAWATGVDNAPPTNIVYNYNGGNVRYYPKDIATSYTISPATYNSNVTFVGGAALTYNSGAITCNSTCTNNGNLSLGGNVLTLGASSTLVNNGTITTSVTLTIPSGASFTNNGTISTSAATAFSDSRSTKTFGGTVTYNSATGGQTIATGTYTNLTLSNTSLTNTAGGTIAVSGVLTTTSGGTLEMGSSMLTLSATGTVLTNGGTITTSAATPFTDSRTTKTFGGTVTYNSTTGGQTIANGTYTNLTMGNTSGTNTLIGSTIVTGVLSTANSAGNLALGNHWLTVARFSGPGHITGSANARITYTGSTASFLYMDSTSATTNNKLRRLTLSSNANLSLGNTLSIDGHYNNKDTGEVVLNTGATLTSNIVGTASARLRLNYTDTTNRAHPNIYIGHTSGASIGKVVGEIYIQDFLQGGFDKRYRQWGHPLDSTAGMSLNQFSDEIDCFGVVMSPDNSGRGSGKNINGLYQSQTTPTIINNSIFKYDESQYGTASRWVPFTSSGSTLYLEKGLGYMFVMRPSGSSTGGGTSATAPQFVGIEGQMNFANVTVTGLKISSTLKSAGTGGYNLLSNPYPTHLDLSTFFNDNTNLNTTFYKYNKASKNYETYTKGTSNWSKGANTINPIIEPMDAFWVQLNNSGTPTTDANFKITQTTILSNSSGVDRTNKLEIDSTHYLNVGIKLTTQNDASVNDEAALYLGYNESDLSYKFRSGDATKLSGTCNELNIQSVSGEKLATKSLDLRRDWSVPLNIKVCKLGVYDFVFDVVTNVDLSKYDIEFYDKLTGKSTPIVVGQNIKVDINSVANEFIEGRFFISLKNSQAKINTVGNTTGVILYPNPVSKTDVAHISILNNEKGNVQLMDSRGKVIMSQYYNGFSETVNIDLKKYSICEGIYFVSFKSESSNQTIKLSIF